MQLGYVIAYVPDVPAAVAFYGAAFGLQPRFVHESGYAEMETGATALAFASEALAGSQGFAFAPHRPGAAPAATEIGLVTTDVPGAVERAVAAGAVLLKGAETKPWGQVVAYVRDPDGILIELCTPVGGPGSS